MLSLFLRVHDYPCVRFTPSFRSIYPSVPPSIHPSIHHVHTCTRAHRVSQTIDMHSMYEHCSCSRFFPFHQVPAVSSDLCMYEHCSRSCFLPSYQVPAASCDLCMYEHCPLSYFLSFIRFLLPPVIFWAGLSVEKKVWQLQSSKAHHDCWHTIHAKLVPTINCLPWQ